MLTCVLDDAKVSVMNMLVSKHNPYREKKANTALYCHCSHSYTLTGLFFPTSHFLPMNVLDNAVKTINHIKF